MSLVPQAAILPESVVMLKIVTVAIVTLYLTLLVGQSTAADRRLSRRGRRRRSWMGREIALPVGWQIALVLLAFGCLCELTLIDDDASRAVVQLPSPRGGAR